MNHPTHRLRSKKRYVILCFVGITAIVFVSIFVAHGARSSSPASSAVGLLSSGWDYLSGITPQADGLHVAYVGRAIVQQDGSAGQINPAVNLYGTHLSAPGDVTLNASVTDRRGEATLSFYASPPIIQDEFRVEPPSLSLTLTDAGITISRQQGYAHQDLYKQLPTTSQFYALAESTSAELALKRQGTTLSVLVDGKKIATLPSPFTSDVWFGLSADHTTSRWTLAHLQATGSDVAAVNTASMSPTPLSNGTSLQTLASAKRPGFLIGAAMALGPSVADSGYARLAFGGNFGSLTPENAMKWQFIQPQPTTYDFKEADALVAIALNNHLSVHGHTLVFGEANPAWVQQLPVTTAADKANVQRVMIDHITQTVRHFTGRVASWDVVNEPLAEEDNGPPLRHHIWEQAMGPDYIAIAFDAAHTADPNAKLYLNDYGLEADGVRWNNLLTLVTALKAQGVPIDGIGMQAHVYEASDVIDPNVLRTHIRTLAALGLTTRISEMDVYSDDGTTVQADQYAAVLGICFSEPSCISWSTWGVTDRYDLYQSDTNQLAYGTDFLWDKTASLTPAVTALERILK